MPIESRVQRWHALGGAGAVLSEVLVTRVLGGCGMQFGALMQVLFLGVLVQVLSDAGHGGRIFARLAGGAFQILLFSTPQPAPNFKHLCCPHNWSTQKHLSHLRFLFHTRKPLNSTQKCP